ncbi:MAG: hypothetical protein R3A10_07940 [Caldilineaceae bacterium]
MATKTVTQQRLPDNPWIIRDGAPIGLELRGFVVDLETGEHTLPPRYTPTAAGVAAARPWTPREEVSSGG